MKAKKMNEALQQMAEEGVVQGLQSPLTGRPLLSASWGALQARCPQAAHGGGVFAAHRLRDVPVSNVCRWVEGTLDEVERFSDAHRGDMAPGPRWRTGLPCRQRLRALGYEATRWPQVTFKDVKDYQVAKAA